MGDAPAVGLDGLPHHLLHKIMLGDFAAADLACLETSCYTFRAAAGIEPYRFKSVIENAAFQICQSDGLFRRLPSPLQSRLVRRCGGNWKLVLRFLQSTHQAATGVSTAIGKAQVVAGKYVTFVIKEQGELFGCGSNKFGVLGQGTLVDDFMVPVKIPVPTGLHVKQVSGTHHHVGFVTESGQVFTYGDNSSGCCGHGDVDGPICKPTLVESLKDIPCKQVSTGLSFTAAVTKQGEIYSWGSASHGQLGHGQTADQSRPVRIDSLATVGAVTQIATGGSYTLSVMSNGDLYSFGYGGNYCLGHNNTASEWLPQKVILHENSFITSVAAGDEHSVALSSQGQVYTWGKGYCGALGHGDEVDVHTPKIVRALQDVRAVQVSAARRKTFVLADTNDMFAFGWMAFGMLGLTDSDSSDKVLVPVRMLERHIAQVSAGFYHVVALTSDGLFVPFGDNEKGQLNYESEFPRRSSSQLQELVSKEGESEFLRRSPSDSSLKVVSWARP